MSICPVLLLVHSNQVPVPTTHSLPLTRKLIQLPVCKASQMDLNHTEFKPSPQSLNPQDSLTLDNVLNSTTLLPYLKAIVMAADAKMFEGNLWAV